MDDFDKVQTLFGNPLFELKRGSAGLRVGIQLVKSADALEVCVVGCAFVFGSHVSLITDTRGVVMVHSAIYSKRGLHLTLR